MRNIAFIDPFGGSYNDATLAMESLGGAEQCVVYIARELVDLGYTVTVYNHIEKTYTHGNLTYKPISEVVPEHDIVICLRSVMPFIDDLHRGMTFPSFKEVMARAKYRVLWRHDTYVEGDGFIQELAEKGVIHKVFTLSDWHTEHTVSNLLDRKYIWQTRNGINYVNFSSGMSRDPNMFVWNAAAYKGLTELIEDYWPKILERLPNARLRVIGGYYKGIKDSSYYEVKRLRALNPRNVHFMNTITPYEVAVTLRTSGYFLYPCTFPETFGISTVEAQAYGCIPIVIPQGALSTSAGPYSYVTDKEHFVDTVIAADSSTNQDFREAASKWALDKHLWVDVVKEWDKHFKSIKQMKSILIAVPTTRYIEPETFESIYSLEIPEGYRADFRTFFGYLVDATRNTMAAYAINCGYDYMFSVDSDIVLPNDTLKKLLSHDKDIVSGMYRMRRPEEHIEIYDLGYRLLPPSLLKEHNGLLEIGGCGFGCNLTKTHVLQAVSYPQFHYHQAYRFEDTFSEDNDFCRKAAEKGFKIFCDTSIRCLHKGTVLWEITA